MIYRRIFVFTSGETVVDTATEKIVHAQPWRPRSSVYVCDTCGLTYARLEVWAGDRLQPFETYLMRCEQCPADLVRFQWPGSIIREWDEHFNDGLPLEVLQREARIHLKHRRK